MTGFQRLGCFNIWHIYKCKGNNTMDVLNITCGRRTASSLTLLLSTSFIQVSVCFQATRCPRCSRVPSMPRPVRSFSNTFASVGHLRSVFTPACCWCSCVEVSAGGASSSPTYCRSSTTLSNCSSSPRTGKNNHIPYIYHTFAQ